MDQIKIINKRAENCDYAVYIGRGSPLGNPFFFGSPSHPQAKYPVKDRNEAISQFKVYLENCVKDGVWDVCDAINDLVIRKLLGEEIVLSCFCSPKPCHGEVVRDFVERQKYCINWFSNMREFEEPLFYGGDEYRTVENFYQAMKVPKDNKDIRREISLMKPFESKKFGRKIQVREDWEEIKVEVMRFALKHKFQRGSFFYNQLLKCNKPIVERNNWGDEFWGVNIFNNQGRNVLGGLIEELKPKQESICEL